MREANSSSAENVCLTHAGYFSGQPSAKDLAQQFAGLHGVEQAFAGQRIDPRGGVADQSPILAEDGAFGKRAFFRRRQNVAVEARALDGDASA